jgi:hypothetical protein
LGFQLPFGKNAGYKSRSRYGTGFGTEIDDKAGFGFKKNTVYRIFLSAALKTRMASWLVLQLRKEI